MNLRGVLLALCLSGLAACATTGSQQASSDRQEAARSNMQLGVEHLRRGQLVAAEDSLQRAVRLDPQMAEAQTALGWLYQQLNETRKAEQAYRRGLELRPDDPSMANNLGVFLCGQGRTQEGLSLLTRAAGNPRYGTPEAAWTNAAVCVRSSDPQQAEGFLRRALEREPQFPDALLQMAALSYARQDHLRARAFLSRLEATGTVTAEALLMRARTERALGDAETARQYWERLRTEFPEFQEALAAPNP